MAKYWLADLGREGKPHADAAIVSLFRAAIGWPGPFGLVPAPLVPAVRVGLSRSA